MVMEKNTINIAGKKSAFFNQSKSLQLIYAMQIIDGHIKQNSWQVYPLM